jgi:CO/xanthine dehydrogenase FAD-binding subunit
MTLGVGSIGTAGGYLRPRTLADAVAAASVDGTTVLAGGTDLYPAHVGRPFPARILDVSAVVEMRGIVPSSTGVRIGGAVTWTELARATLPPAFLALQDAARQVGSAQVQNRGTIAGNLCNASPAADGVPPLLVLNAEVELAHMSGLRRMPLADFITGYRKTALKHGEIVSGVIVPAAQPEAMSAFVKLGARKYLVISIVMAAAVICRDRSGRIVDARVAVGSASEKAQRLTMLESALVGMSALELPSRALRPEHLASLSPIDDVRATASYRLEAARHLVGTALDQAAGAPS